MELGDYSANRRRAATQLQQRQMEGQNVSNLGELAQRDNEQLAAAEEYAHPQMTEDPGRMQRLLAGVDPTNTSDEPDTEPDPMAGGIRSQSGAQ